MKIVKNKHFVTAFMATMLVLIGYIYRSSDDIKGRFHIAFGGLLIALGIVMFSIMIINILNHK